MGPTLLTEAVNIHKLQRYIMPFHIFCPIEYWNYQKTIQPIHPMIINDSKAVHLWNEMWRRNNMDKSAQYRTDSLYEKLKAHYLSD
ncbi:hypothetical protein [Candidatus Albibeggiatoa sp. nov. BB20]|uniref:hypothetical protein n=1 Tax=Candidatus Albibeggiatoa sp. nov. BB20 TaxID=3162723 RepID=UPI003365B21A